MRARYWLTLGCGLVLALVFLTSGAGKLLGQSAYLLSVSSLTFLPETFLDIIGNWLPWAELLLGAVLMTGVFIQPAALLSAVLSGAFIFHNIWMITYGQGYQLSVYPGILEKLFHVKLSSTGALFTDIGMVALAVVVYFGSTGKFLDWRPWPVRRVKVSGTPSTAGSPESAPAYPDPRDKGN